MGDNISYAALYLAEALIAWLYCERIYGRRRKLPLMLAAFAAGYSLLFGVYLLDSTFLNIASFFAANAVLVFAGYGSGAKAAVLHAAFLAAVMVGAEIVIALAVRLFGFETAADAHVFTTALAIMSKLLYLTLSFVGAWFFTPQKKTPEEPKTMALFLGLSIISMLLSVLMVYLGSNSGLTGTTESTIVQNIFALLTVNLLFLLICNRFGRTGERPAPEPSPQRESVYYSELQEQYNSQRRLIHDIKNHLHAIEGLAVEGNADEVVSYISELEGELTPSSPVRLSSDPVLNSILVRFRKDCADRGVAFVSDLREGGAALLDATEVTTLYGNLLSNAIEAAERSDEKNVELTVVRNAEQGVLLITVSNSCDAAPKKNAAGRMLSQKRGGRTPGLGLRNIERVVQKHRGVETMYYDAESRRFHHIIQFPVTR